ncbi:MAG TPA: hypothetical protein VGE74_08435 [Gemmata sp.]
MTEEEWFASNDPGAAGKAVCRKKRASARVLRLYMAAFWGWQANRLHTAEERERLRARAALVGRWAESGVRPPETIVPGITLVFFNRSPREGFLNTVSAPAGWDDSSPPTERALWTLHEVFGNPFVPRRRKNEPPRGWAFDPNWRTDTAVLLARQMYDSGDFSAMPILADALQDAGCNNDDILAHCRKRPGEHVRGCWVLDLILRTK